MNTTVDFTANAPTKGAYATPNLAPEAQAASPAMIVLQPSGALDRVSSSSFRSVLEEALEQVTDGVIVDLLWIESTDSDGISALMAGIQRATVLGKLLSFQAMDIQTRTALEAEWARQRELNFGPWIDMFGQDLEGFLNKFARG